MGTYAVKVNGKEYAVGVAQNGEIRVDGKSVGVDLCRMDSTTFSVLLDGNSVRIVASKRGGVYHVLLNSEEHEIRVETDRQRLLREFSDTVPETRARSEIRAPMPALIVKIEVEVGEEVKEGQGLLILEAMKMENEIKAHQSGRVKQILVSNGKPVDKGEVLIRLE